MNNEDLEELKQETGDASEERMLQEVKKLAKV